MNKLIIATGALAMSLAGFNGMAVAQNSGAPAVEANASGTCVTSPRPGNAGGWLITCGDIGPGSGMLVVRPPASRPPSTLTAPEPVAVVPEGSVPGETISSPDAAVGSATDQDGDNYADDLEWNLGLDPTNPDTDEDGIADGDEITIYLTDPVNWDTDGDSLGDGQELFATGTDPLVWNDTSAASSPQTLAQEAALPAPVTSQPNQAVPLAQETTEVLTADDGRAAALGTGNASASPGSVTRGGVSGTSLLGPDGSYSVSEISPPVVNVSGATSQPPSVIPAAANTTAPAEPIVADTTTVAPATDADGDNYADSLEWEIGLDANNPDSDADGVADGDEITIYLTDPFAWDTDGDGIADGEELFGIQTNPLAWDTNGDGLGDGQAVTGA